MGNYDGNKLILTLCCGNYQGNLVQPEPVRCDDLTKQAPVLHEINTKLCHLGSFRRISPPLLLHLSSGSTGQAMAKSEIHSETPAAGAPSTSGLDAAAAR